MTLAYLPQKTFIEKAYKRFIWMFFLLLFIFSSNGHKLSVTKLFNNSKSNWFLIRKLLLSKHINNGTILINWTES